MGINPCPTDKSSLDQYKGLDDMRGVKIEGNDGAEVYFLSTDEPGVCMQKDSYMATDEARSRLVSGGRRMYEMLSHPVEGAFELVEKYWLSDAEKEAAEILTEDPNFPPPLQIGSEDESNALDDITGATFSDDADDWIMYDEDDKMTRKFAALVAVKTGNSDVVKRDNLQNEEGFRDVYYFKKDPKLLGSLFTELNVVANKMEGLGRSEKEINSVRKVATDFLILKKESIVPMSDTESTAWTLLSFGLVARVTGFFPDVLFTAIQIRRETKKGTSSRACPPCPQDSEPSPLPRGERVRERVTLESMYTGFVDGSREIPECEDGQYDNSGLINFGVEGKVINFSPTEEFIRGLPQESWNGFCRRMAMNGSIEYYLKQDVDPNSILTELNNRYSLPIKGVSITSDSLKLGSGFKVEDRPFRTAEPGFDQNKWFVLRTNTDEQTMNTVCSLMKIYGDKRDQYILRHSTEKGTFLINLKRAKDLAGGFQRLKKGLTNVNAPEEQTKFAEKLFYEAKFAADEERQKPQNELLRSLRTGAEFGAGVGIIGNMAHRFFLRPLERPLLRLFGIGKRERCECAPSPEPQKAPVQAPEPQTQPAPVPAPEIEQPVVPVEPFVIVSIATLLARRLPFTGSRLLSSFVCPAVALIPGSSTMIDVLGKDPGTINQLRRLRWEYETTHLD